MHSNEFEESFSKFLEGRTYDEAEEWLFSLLRSAFAAGWKAAGGQPPTSHRLYELIRREDK